MRPQAEAMHPLRVDLGQALHDRSLVGGKGASLSELFVIGAPCRPPAFALTTTAYATFATANALPACVVETTMEDLPNIRQSIMTAPLGDRILDAIGDIHRVLIERDGTADAAVAVRSSGTAEDSAAHSFAGLHDSVLDVRTRPGLESAVRRCWASLWSDRAVAYRHEHGLADEPVEIAVVVQRLVRPDVSFVVFTADPLGGDSDRVVISASWGLGEAVVSGLVTPDHIAVGSRGDILEYSVGVKERMVIPGTSSEGGSRVVAVPRAMQTTPVMSGTQAAEIATLARTVADRLGYPADLEGAIAGDRIYLFQARPITTIGR